MERSPATFVARRALLAICFLLLPVGVQAAGKPDMWRELREGRAFAIMRHALAPGTGDPANFRIGDCATQRNLSREGLAQAARIGAAMRRRGIAKAAVFTSQWCRCIDTARQLGLGAVTQLPALNSFFARPGDKNAKMAELRAWLDRRKPDSATVLVTHQVNITALTGIFPRSGEVVIARLRPGSGIEVLGRF